MSELLKNIIDRYTESINKYLEVKSACKKEFVTAESKAAFQELENNIQLLERTMNITSEQLLEILHNQTGKEFKFLPVKGYIMNDSQYGLPLKPYGLLLVREDNEHYAKDCYQLPSFCNNPFNSIQQVPNLYEVCIGGAYPESSAEQSQDKLENLNWSKYYIYSKAVELQQKIYNIQHQNFDKDTLVTLPTHKLDYNLGDYNLVAHIYSRNSELANLIIPAIEQEFGLTNEPEDTNTMN